MKTVIEPIRPEDADEISELIEAAHRVATVPIGPRWTREQVEAECRESGLVVRDSLRGVLAFILYRDVGEAWEIGFLATRNDARGHGFMTDLIKEFLRLRPKGKAIWLEVHESNQPARRLYESLGFQQSAKRPKYYADGGAAVLYNYG